MANLASQPGDGKRGRGVIAAALRKVEAVVGRHFPEALDPLKAALAVVAVGSLSDNRQPTTLIFVARSGAGKTLVLMLLTPTTLSKADPLTAHFYRSDDFTAASFVSHRADVKDARLRQIDLLPRLKGKTLLTKELAPFFTGKREDLLKRIAIVTAILDGQGFLSDSGAHGRRGYADPINFQWLGATTPLEREVLAIMAQLGPRLLFYGADRPDKTTDDLLAVVRGVSTSEAIHKCREAVQHYLLTFLSLRLPSTVRSDAIEFDSARLRRLVLWAQALAALRASIKGNQVTREHPERVLGILRNFSIGSALVHGRLAVDDYDLAQVAHIPLSSGIAGRGRVFRAALENGGAATTPEIAARVELSVPTLLKYMRDPAAVGLGSFTDGAGTRPARIEIASPFSELCDAPLLKAKRGEGENGAA